MGPPGWASTGWAGPVGLGDRWPREGRWEDQGLELVGGGRAPLRRVSQAKQISPELSALAVYCCATRLRTLRPAPVPPQPCHVSSLSERQAKKLSREAGGGQDAGHLRQEGGGDRLWGPGDSGWVGDADVDLERRVTGLWGQ